MMPHSITSLFSFISIILAVAFFTLFERKGLSYIQNRKGPNKVGLLGLPQPLMDATKLLTKEMTKLSLINQIPYFLAPALSFSLALIMWQLYPLSSMTQPMKWGALLFLTVSSMNVYGTLLAGWASNSKYALLGALRAIAQTISYEVTLALILLFALFSTQTLNLMEIKMFSNLTFIALLFMPISLVWLIACIAETNRAPFDFAEGESELVSGFNIEYGASGFALIFLAEYANILLMSMLTTSIFFGASKLMMINENIYLMKILGLTFFFIWARATLPRFRYDLLMNLTWKHILPLALSVLSLIIMLY
uniref:NADH-ubiquinone oxidoreductase chain 1 n=1 Tax=Georissa bangueyensis TaxID=1882664 RepID=A0A1B2G3D4_9GAST|nr:NADH dehydrogenase subunit 1 [Georissa bangueyensis]